MRKERHVIAATRSVPKVTPQPRIQIAGCHAALPTTPHHEFAPWIATLHATTNYFAQLAVIISPRLYCSLGGKNGFRSFDSGGFHAHSRGLAKFQN